MNPPLLIRPALTADLPEMMLLVAAVVPLMNAAGNFQWDATYPNTSVLENDIALGQLWIAECEGEIAGFAAITTDQDEEYAQLGWDLSLPAIVTHRLAVHPRFQGRGVAKALLMQAESEAMRRHIPRLRIDTNSENAATRHLFPALGYRFAGEIGLNFRPGLRFFGYEKLLDDF